MFISHFFPLWTVWRTYAAYLLTPLPAFTTHLPFFSFVLFSDSPQSKPNPWYGKSAWVVNSAKWNSYRVTWSSRTLAAWRAVGHVTHWPYLGSVTLLSNNWLMVYGDFESRSHQFPRVWRLPHYLRPFTTALRKFYSQIRLNKVFSKKIIFGVWSSGSRRLDGHLLHWKGIREASDDDRAGTPFRLPPSVLQGWVFTRSNVTKTVTQVTSCPQTLFWGEVGLG